MASFKKEYRRLNPQQKQAVDTIEGPVMVIAGAGTGKTQTIALRIANILDKTQTPPSSILCLTFTDSAAANMRQRLVDIIGSTAYSIRVHTFHSFCNDVILSNPDYFIFAKELEPLEELEKIDIIQQLIESLPPKSLLQPWGDHFYYQRQIISHIQTLKRENISPADLLSVLSSVQDFLKQSASIHQSLKNLRYSKTLESDLLALFGQLTSVKDIPSGIQSRLNLLNSYYQKNISLGPAKNPETNFKNRLVKLLDSLQKDLPKQFEFQSIYQQYQQQLQSRGRYDFDDMILFTLNAFTNHPELLQTYQELYQYILVDEFQDTNTAQNQIIDLLGSYFSQPNIFVVGDDDQSIFRFQGASMENIFSFYQQYQPTTIVLKNNYRSHQLILDSSQSVINHNQNRITNYIKDIDKSLVSNQKYDPNPINLLSCAHQSDESYLLALKIKQLIDTNVPPSQIAVLHRTNADIDDLLPFLNHFKLTYQTSSSNSVLDNPYIQQVIALFAYLADPTSDDQLYRLLSCRFVGLSSLNLFRLNQQARRQHQSLSQLVDQSDLKPLKKLNRRLHRANRWLQIYSLDRFFNKTIRLFHLLEYLLQSNGLTNIIHLNTLYAEIKKLPQPAKLSDLLNRLNLYDDNNLSLTPSINISHNQAINLLTVHKAKGLEFDHVFLYKCLDKKWGNNTVYSSLNLPPGILKTEISRLATDDNEDERRLFYVALTRAKKQIYISYSANSDQGRQQLPSQFISEIDPKLIDRQTPPDSTLKSLSVRLAHHHFHLHPNLQTYLKSYLSSHYQFNVTHLNSYLRCPRCFYYKTILRIPLSRDKFAALGTAVHRCLSQLYSQPLSQPQLLSLFKKFLKQEGLSAKHYRDALARGQESLADYYQHYHSSFSQKCLVDYDFSPRRIRIDGVPVTGKIDKIEIIHPKKVNVVDFKTGNPDYKSSQIKPDGDYFRQLAFYYLLAQSDPDFKYTINQGVIDFVQKSQRKNTFIRHQISINSQHLQNLKDQIKTVYQQILNLEFDQIGSDCQDRHHLHRLTNLPQSS